MKQLVFILAVVPLLLASCAKQEDLDDLELTVNALEQYYVTSIEEQAANINRTVSDLETAMDMVGAKISSLEKRAGTAADSILLLRTGYGQLAGTIAGLRTYAEELASGDKTWTEATFATIEQMTGVQKRLGDLETLMPELSGAVKTMETDVKKWVGVELEAYAAIASLETALETAGSSFEGRLAAAKDSLAVEVTQLKDDLKTLKTTVTKEYQDAIQAAIEESNGTIGAAPAKMISDATDAFNDVIQPLLSRMSSLETRMSAVKTLLNSIIGRIQCVTVVPDFTDGSVETKLSSSTTVRFEISPAAAAKALMETKGAESFFGLHAVETQTGGVIDFDIESAAMDANSEFVELTILPNAAFTAVSHYVARLQIEANAGRGDYVCKTSDYFALKPDKKPQQIFFKSPTVVWTLDDYPIGRTVAPQTLEGAMTTPVFTSSNESVATFIAEGDKIIIKGPGKTTITAVAQEANDYAAATASYELIILTCS